MHQHSTTNFVQEASEEKHSLAPIKIWIILQFVYDTAYDTDKRSRRRDYASSSISMRVKIRTAPRI